MHSEQAGFRGDGRGGKGGIPKRGGAAARRTAGAAGRYGPGPGRRRAAYRFGPRARPLAGAMAAHARRAARSMDAVRTGITGLRLSALPDAARPAALGPARHWHFWNYGGGGGWGTFIVAGRRGGMNFPRRGGPDRYLGGGGAADARGDDPGGAPQPAACRRRRCRSGGSPFSHSRRRPAILVRRACAAAPARGPPGAPRRRAAPRAAASYPVVAAGCPCRPHDPVRHNAER